MEYPLSLVGLTQESLSSQQIVSDGVVVVLLVVDTTMTQCLHLVVSEVLVV